MIKATDSSTKEEKAVKPVGQEIKSMAFFVNTFK